VGQNDLRVHLGLGAAVAVDRIDIRWPSGPVGVLKAVAAQQVVAMVEERESSSTTP
jgi:hypothetical protein